MNIACDNEFFSSSTLVCFESMPVVSGLTINVPETFLSNSTLVAEAKEHVVNNGLAMNGFSDTSSHWTAEANFRFKELSIKESVGELSIPEQVELDELSSLRRSKKYPRKADEILWERKQRKLTDSLVQALTKYVEFYEPTHQA